VGPAARSIAGEDRRHPCGERALIPAIDPDRDRYGGTFWGARLPGFMAFLAACQAPAKVLCKQEVAGSIPAGSAGANSLLIGGS